MFSNWLTPALVVGQPAPSGTSNITIPKLADGQAPLKPISSHATTPPLLKAEMPKVTDRQAPLKPLSSQVPLFRPSVSSTTNYASLLVSSGSGNSASSSQQPAQGRTLVPADRLPPFNGSVNTSTTKGALQVFNWHFGQIVDGVNWRRFNEAVRAEQARLGPEEKKEFDIRMFGDGQGQPLAFDRLVESRRTPVLSAAPPSFNPPLSRPTRDVVTTGTICVTRNGVFATTCDRIMIPPLTSDPNAWTSLSPQEPTTFSVTKPPTPVWDRPSLLPRSNAARRYWLIDTNLQVPKAVDGAAPLRPLSSQTLILRPVMTAAQTSRVQPSFNLPGQPNHTISNFQPFQLYSSSMPTTSRVVPNGCGSETSFFSPNWLPQSFGRADFGKACNAHDICYGTLWANRNACDSRFLQDMNRSCWTTYGFGPATPHCLDMANAYYSAVRIGAGTAFRQAQMEALRPANSGPNLFAPQPAFTERFGLLPKSDAAPKYKLLDFDLSRPSPPATTTRPQITPKTKGR